MTRLIVLTFAFLGWAFYEMSGGAGFEPRGLRPAKPERIARAPTPAPEPLVFPVKAEELVVKSALGQSKRIPATSVLDSPTDEGAPPVQVAVTGDLSAFRQPSAQITLASLEQGIAALRQKPSVTLTDPMVPASVPEPTRDIREVTGMRVNMRDGPGTIYPVVGRLRIGHRVEVLDDSGNGWLRLRVLPGQQVGWISASLVRKIAN